MSFCQSHGITTEEFVQLADDADVSVATLDDILRLHADLSAGTQSSDDAS
jgi:hypothetical protein